MVGAVPMPSDQRADTLEAGDIDPATGKRVLYWHDPMVPGRRFDAPGQSPFMNMRLVPVYEDGSDGGGVTVSPRIQQNLGIRTAEVLRQTMTPRVETVGTVAFNERDQVVVQARAAGYVEALHVRATFDRVRAGQPVADLYVPEWIAAQEEFLAVRRFSGTNLATLVDGARQRLRQAGMTDEQIRGVETRGVVQPRITLTSPIDGVVGELATREGMTVMAGETLFRINGLSNVWVNAAVPESQAQLLRPGAPASARSLALPGAELRGNVQAILPDVDPVTRTIRVRVELANPELALAPGMFVNVSLEAAPREALVVPSEAVISTGTRTVVILTDGAGNFRPVDVEAGLENDGNTEVTRGLEVGQSVVVSGQFLLDSEASLRATATRMQDVTAGDATGREHRGEGRVVALDDDSVTLSHGPIPSIEWTSMTMQFVLPTGPRPDLAIDEQVRFTFTMGADGRPRLTSIEPAEPGR
ncbi:MAG TPA: efflux RND transporter periplasmic adaptor subunit [Vicinamibacterales bacterium]|nr:efflux RND transporter periplasmic adaptor subunit [Vicinamibacterales bacterium]